jgi:gliding motility-associated-like protein
MYKINVLLLLFLAIQFKNIAQCPFTVSSFPYTQNFEVNTGGWTSGGLGNDWAWGAPSKAFITNAGGGTKCWVIGGLNGSFYTNGERSYVTSPCFDFTSIPNPVISFKIYWECENTYDGATFQSSLDNGLTWTNVGSDGEATNCMTQNWFNSSNIINLSTLANPRSGWAGSALPTSGSCQGGNGSNGWVTAKHCLNNLGGLPSVRFRMAFGAGTACNAYDGIAFDEILIENAPSNNANFTYNCTSTNLQYQFTNASSLCPTNFVWNFGDPASGSNNGSGQQNPTHTFSAPGTYTVTLTVSGPCNGTSTITKTISTLDALSNTTNILCSGSQNGSLNFTAINNTGVTSYVLQPLGLSNTNGNFTGLGAGSYTVTISDAIGCSITETSVIQSPPSLVWVTNIAENITCHGLQDGKITGVATGGSGAINYTLNPGSISNSTGLFTNLSAAQYTIIAIDANGCSLTSIQTIIDPPSLNLINTSFQDILCYGSNTGQISLSYSGGTGPLSYQLSPGSISNATGIFTNLAMGNYTVICSDINGCSATNSFTISEPPLLKINTINIKQPGCNPNNDGTATIDAIGGNPPLKYSIGGVFGTNNFFANLTSNTYTVVVKDANDCTMSSIIILQSENAPQFNSVVIKDITCADKTDGIIEVNAISNVPIQNYILTPGGSINTNGNFNSLGAANYIITVTDANGCSNTTQATIQEPSRLQIDQIDFLMDSCGSNSSGKLICYASGGTGNYRYVISPGGISQSSSTFNNLNIGNYQITVLDANACSASKNVVIPEKICCEEVFVPNAFSPNNDGRNDEFAIKGANGIELKEFYIFNRWGQLVFSGQHLEDSWNGHYKGIDAELGTYYYQIKYRCISSNKLYILKGDLILIR